MLPFGTANFTVAIMMTAEQDSLEEYISSGNLPYWYDSKSD
jgi:hypothetical protein